MSTNEEIKRAVVFQEGENIRAVAAWTRNSETKEIQLVSIELEMREADAMGAFRWSSYDGVMSNGSVWYGNSPVSKWAACMLISRAERWFKENV